MDATEGGLKPADCESFHMRRRNAGQMAQKRWRLRQPMVQRPVCNVGGWPMWEGGNCGFTARLAQAAEIGQGFRRRIIACLGRVWYGE